MHSLSQITPGAIEYSLVKLISVKDISKSKINSYFQSIQGADETGQVLITIFRNDLSDFPFLKQGDIIFFQGKFAQSPFGNRMQASVASDCIVEVVCDLDAFLRDFANLEIPNLRNRFVSLGAVEMVISRQREYKTLNKIEKNIFFDLYGLLINKFYGNTIQSCIMIEVVDFTIHKDLKLNKRLDIPGLALDEPCILTITLWDENVDLVSNIPLNSFISLRNVRSKISAGGFLEGVIHTDRTFQNLKAVQVLESSHPAVLEMNQYFFSKNLMDRRLLPVLQSEPVLKSLTRLLEGASLEKKSVSSILNSNSHFRAKIRVRLVDYLPKKLEYFSRPVCTNCQVIYDPLDYPEKCKCGINLDSCFKYLFSLLVSDETASIPLICSDQEAIDFLSNLLPLNLCKDQDSLKSLQSLISRVRNDYFECLIESFKPIETDDSLWRFKIFNTVIQKM